MWVIECASWQTNRITKHTIAVLGGHKHKNTNTLSTCNSFFLLFKTFCFFSLPTYYFQLLCLLALATAEPAPAPGRIPKVYNALITSNQNLEPSKAYPVYQPVLHDPFAFPYQPAVFYGGGDFPLTNVSSYIKFNNFCLAYKINLINNTYIVTE